jgi:hypothetical protein
VTFSFLVSCFFPLDSSILMTEICFLQFFFCSFARQPLIRALRVLRSVFLFRRCTE